MTTGCSSDPDPSQVAEDLTPQKAYTLIADKWAHGELNHFTVSFHSDTVIQCGIQNDLWKAVQTPHLGFTINTWQLTDAGRQVLFAIDLKESGKSHEVSLLGPYNLDVTGVGPGPQPDLRQATFRWEIDWNKAPAAMKACLPRFELSGTQTAIYKLNGQDWSLVSFLKPGEVLAPQPTDATPSILH